jgi:hypothetical protein
MLLIQTKKIFFFFITYYKTDGTIVLRKYVDNDHATIGNLNKVTIELTIETIGQVFQKIFFTNKKLL